MVALAVALVGVARPAPLRAQPASPTAAPGAVAVGALLRATLSTLPPAPAAITLDRVTFGPGGAEPMHTAAGPELAYVEAGSLTLQAGGPVQVERAPGGTGTPAPTAVASPGPARALGAGDALIVPTGTPYALRNAGTAAATVLSARIVPAGTTAPAAAPAPGSDVLLARGTATALPAAPVLLTLNRVAYAPGAAIAAYPHTGPVLAYVEAGTLALPTAGGQVDVTHTVVPATPGAQSGTPVLTTPGTTATLRAGDSAFIHAGTVSAASNPGTGQLTLLVLALAPATP